MAETEETVECLKWNNLNMELPNHLDFHEEDQHKKVLFCVPRYEYRDCELTALVFAHCMPCDRQIAWVSFLQFVRHGRGRFSSSHTNWREVRCSDSSDGTATAVGHFNCLEAHIRTTLKIHCITHSLNLDMSNQHDVTRYSLATRGDVHKVFKAANCVVDVQERDCFQCKACTSTSHAGWRLTVLKPLCLSFLSLLRISQSEKTEYHSFKLKAHFKRSCCHGRIFHHVHADHKMVRWLAAVFNCAGPCSKSRRNRSYRRHCWWDKSPKSSGTELYRIFPNISEHTYQPGFSISSLRLSLRHNAVIRP